MMLRERPKGGGSLSGESVPDEVVEATVVKKEKPKNYASKPKKAKQTKRNRYQG